MARTSKSSNTGSASRSTASSLIGIGIGTIAALYGQSEVQTFWTKIVGILAPALAVAGDQISAVLYGEIVAWNYQRKVNKQHERIRAFLHNPDTSEGHKEDLKRQMESLELESVKNGPLLNSPLDVEGATNRRTPGRKRGANTPPPA